MLRSRSVIRGELEKPSFSAYREVSNFIKSLEGLRMHLTGVKEVPTEVVGEMSRNVSSIVSEFQMTMDSNLPDTVQLQMTMIRTSQYLTDLNTKLEENGYLSPKSSLTYRIEELVSGTEQMTDRLQHLRSW